MDFSEYAIENFLTALASDAPTPGGGGASALAAALGAALGGMVTRLTVGKPRYRASEPELYCIMQEAQELQSELTALMQKDADAFAPLAEAYRMDRGDPAYAETMERCLLRAAEPPMEVLRLSCRMIELHGVLAEKGSALAVSDAGTGVALCAAAMYGAAMNVAVNTRLMRDRVRARAMNAEVDALLQTYGPLAARTRERVYQTLKKEAERT